MFSVADMSVTTRVLRGFNSQSLLARAMSSYTYNSLNVTVPSPYVYNVEMNRPKKMNALNKELWTEIGDVFTKLSTDPDCRVVVLSASGKMFSSGEFGLNVDDLHLRFFPGIDLGDLSQLASVVYSEARDEQ